MTEASTPVRFVAIGDSFTEGVGDEAPSGVCRGWADLTAIGWARALGTPIAYANLAIRGKLAWPVVEEQLEPALALKPTHLSFNGGGNDMLRPGTDVAYITDAFRKVLRRCDEEGVQLLLLSGANPTAGLPLRKLIQQRGDTLSAAVEASFDGRDDVIRAFNWPDTTLMAPRFWSQDRLHMNFRGHHRVAARVLQSLGHDASESWWDQPVAEHEAERLSNIAFYRAHVAPWVKRRLNRTSSGDGRAAKFGQFVEVAPDTGEYLA